MNKLYRQNAVNKVIPFFSQHQIFVTPSKYAELLTIPLLLRQPLTADGQSLGLIAHLDTELHFDPCRPRGIIALQTGNQLFIFRATRQINSFVAIQADLKRSEQCGFSTPIEGFDQNNGAFGMHPKIEALLLAKRAEIFNRDLVNG